MSEHQYDPHPATQTIKQPMKALTDGQGNTQVVTPSGTPLSVSVVGSIGTVTWGAPTAVPVAAGPTSTTLVIANANRKALRIWNPIGNAQMGYDISGGTAALATATPLLAGDEADFTDQDCPTGAITFIGTAGQSLVYQQGT